MPKSLTSLEALESRIHTIRGLSVLLDADQAGLYGITPGALMQAVRRNAERIPDDFMFMLTNQEVTVLKSQTVISKTSAGRGGRRSNPYAFIDDLSTKVASHDQAIRRLVASIRLMMEAPPEPERREIGFTSPWK